MDNSQLIEMSESEKTVNHTVAPTRQALSIFYTKISSLSGDANKVICKLQQPYLTEKN